MSDSVVILGTVGIVGLVAVTTIALVYGRSLGFSGDQGKIELHTEGAQASESKVIGNNSSQIMTVDQD